jgi:hypothetical protein
VKRLVATLAALAALLAWTATGAAQTIYVRNISTVLTDAQVQQQMPTFQDAFTLDFNPAWGTNTTLAFSPFPPARATVLTIVDEDAQTPGALGYHDVAKGSIPYGVVLAKTALDGGYSVSVTITHELFEMAVDPFTNDAVKVSRYYFPFFLQETADPVEADRLGYLRTTPAGASVLISDFILPHWFRAGSPGPWDFARHTIRALQILKGGYQLAWSRVSQSWTHVCAAGEVCRHRTLR